MAPPRSQSTDSKQTEQQQQQQQSSSPVNQQSEESVPLGTTVSLLSVEEEFKKRQIETAKRFKDLPVKYKGFESLMESSEDEVYYDRPPLPASTKQYILLLCCSIQCAFNVFYCL